MKVRYITHLSKLDGLTPEERRRLEPVARRYVFRLNSYYEQLINWGDPDDPLRRLGMQLQEHVHKERLDPAAVGHDLEHRHHLNHPMD